MHGLAHRFRLAGRDGKFRKAGRFRTRDRDRSNMFGETFKVRPVAEAGDFSEMRTKA